MNHITHGRFITNVLAVQPLFRHCAKCDVSLFKCIRFCGRIKMKSVSFGIAVLFCSTVFSYTMCRVRNMVFQFSDAVLIGVGFRVGNWEVCLTWVQKLWEKRCISSGLYQLDVENATLEHFVYVFIMLERRKSYVVYNIVQWKRDIQQLKRKTLIFWLRWLHRMWLIITFLFLTVMIHTTLLKYVSPFKTAYSMVFF